MFCPMLALGVAFMHGCPNFGNGTAGPMFLRLLRFWGVFVFSAQEIDNRRTVAPRQAASTLLQR